MSGAVGRAFGALQTKDWRNAEEMLATIAELIHDQTLLLMKVNSKKGTKLPKALKIERPWQVEAKKNKPRRNATTEEMIAIFGVPGRRPQTEA